MTPSEYLDAAKQRLNIESDYELAKRLEIPRQYVSAYRKGASIDNLTAFKLAITLELDPATVLADLESQREKDEKKRGFWTGFMRRAAIVAALACTLAWSYSATYEDAARLLGGVAMAASAAYWLRRKYA
ncbi:helix-turn-helix domain-containing protein [Azonexus sp.]|uniref:helix-turn-helix domain-containing protein n=1 Tax=Azonexus sp. TaxID=1872668 RepID=UPI0035B0B352